VPGAKAVDADGPAEEESGSATQSQSSVARRSEWEASA
jgi:hypothetical protein